MWETHRMLGKELAADLDREAAKIERAADARDSGASPQAGRTSLELRWLRRVIERMPYARPSSFEKGR